MTLFGKRGIKVNLENNVLTRLIGFVEKRGNAFCMRLNRFLMRLNNRLCCTSIFIMGHRHILRLLQVPQSTGIPYYRKLT